MFSFFSKVGKHTPIKPVAKIKGGKGNGNVLYLYRKIPDGLSAIDEGKFFDMIELPDGQFNFIVDTREDHVSVLQVTGPSGIGKSTFISNLAMEMKKMFKMEDEDIILVKKSEYPDAAYEPLSPVNLIVNKANFVDEEQSLDKIADGNTKLIIFDDIDGLASSRLKSSYVQFMNQCVCEGRKAHIYTFVANHSTANNKESKLLLSETTDFVFFTIAQPSDLAYTLEKYADIPRAFYAELKKLKSDWVIVENTFPKFILSQSKAWIFDSDRENSILETKKRNEASLKKGR